MAIEATKQKTNTEDLSRLWAKGPANSDDDTKKAQWVKILRNCLLGRSWEMRHLLI